MSDHGKFVWHDLMTSDVEKSKHFYGELFHWTIEKEEHGPYTLIKAGEQLIGGMLPFDKPGMPPHWLGYVSVGNIDEAITRAGAHGGKIVAPKMTIPNVGDFAVAGDPHGAYFSPFQTSHGDGTERPAPAQPPPGTFCWDELTSLDPAASLTYYGHLFGWAHDTMDMGPMGTYYLFKTGDKQVGGMMKTPPGAPPHAHWLAYIAVADTDAVVAHAERLHGKVVAPAMNIPDVGRFAILTDPVGATFGVLGPNK